MSLLPHACHRPLNVASNLVITSLPCDIDNAYSSGSSDLLSDRAECFRSRHNARACYWMFWTKPL